MRVCVAAAAACARLRQQGGHHPEQVTFGGVRSQRAHRGRLLLHQGALTHVREEQRVQKPALLRLGARSGLVGGRGRLRTGGA